MPDKATTPTVKKKYAPKKTTKKTAKTVATRDDFIMTLREKDSYCVITVLKPSVSNPSRSIIESKTFVVPDELGDLDTWVTEKNNNQFNCYLHVNDVDTPINGAKKANKTQVSEDIKLMHVDIDLDSARVKAIGYDKAKQELIGNMLPELINEGAITVTCTGNGLSAYWRHDESVNHIVAEAYNRKAVILYEGDKAATDVARIMRLPDTTNWANEKKISMGYNVSSDSDVLYIRETGSVATLPFYIDPEAVVGDASGAPKVLNNEVHHPTMLKKLRNKLRVSNENYITSRLKYYKRRVKGVDYTDESDEDARIIFWLLWVCRGDVEQVEKLYLTTPFCRRDGKENRDYSGMTYVQYTIKRLHQRMLDNCALNDNPYRGMPVSTNDVLNAKLGILYNGKNVVYVHKESGGTISNDVHLSRLFNLGVATDEDGAPVIKSENKDGDPTYKTAIEHWKACDSKDVFELGEAFRPDMEPATLVEGGRFNTFKGSLAYDVMHSIDNSRFTHESEQLIHSHIKDVWCSGCEASYEYVIGWLARMVQQPHKIGETIVCIQGGQGCIHGDTLIDTPDGQVMVKEFQGGLVNTLNERGEVVSSYAGKPVEYPVTPLFEVSFSNGHSMKVTGEHKFLTETQWVSTDNLVEGTTRVVVGDPVQTTLDTTLSMSLRDADHCSRIVLGFLWHYYACSRPSGVQLPVESSTYQDVLQALVDAQQQCCSLTYEDGQDNESTHNPSLFVYHLSSLVAQIVQEVQGVEGTGSSADDEVFLQLQSLSQALEQSHTHTNLDAIVQESCRFFLCIAASSFCNRTRSLQELSLLLERAVADASYSDSLGESHYESRTGQDASVGVSLDMSYGSQDLYNYTTITSVKSVKSDTYWDLFVPVFNNYLTSGVVNHNSGKSIIGEMVRGWFDKHTYKTSSPEQIVGRFVKPMFNSVFVMFEEAFNGHDHRHVGILKDLVTASNQTVEGKGTEIESVNSCVHIMLLTNDESPIHMESDDRRHFMRRTEEVRGKAYYNELAYAIFGEENDEDIDDTGYKSGGNVGLGSLSFLHTLCTRDNTSFKPNVMPDATDSGSRMLINNTKIDSLGAIDKFIYEWIVENNGSLSDERDWMNGKFHKSEIKEAYDAFCIRTGQHRNDRGAYTKLGTRLGRITMGNNTTKATINGTKANAWNFKELVREQRHVREALGIKENVEICVKSINE